AGLRQTVAGLWEAGETRTGKAFGKARGSQTPATVRTGSQMRGLPSLFARTGGAGRAPEKPSALDVPAGRPGKIARTESPPESVPVWEIRAVKHGFEGATYLTALMLLETATRAAEPPTLEMVGAEFIGQARPLVARYCGECHSTAKQEG